MNHLVMWQNYTDQMELGEDTEIHCLEFSSFRGDATVRSLFLKKISETQFQLSIQLAIPLAHTEVAEREVDEYDNYIDPEEIDGEQVRTQLGDYWVGYDFEHYPDENNIFEFADFSSLGIDKWLKQNDWIMMAEITPGEEIS